MAIRSNMNQALRLLLLLFVTLAAQSLAFAHEFDHLAGGDNSPCLICPLGSNVEAAATESVDAPTLMASAAAESNPPVRARPDAFYITAPARAPPKFL
jgi:hypothetical protein